tara:strand:+ start:1119 stop:1412 length:294 start_codon:yes stop_codon:yes gene_type:complete
MTVFLGRIDSVPLFGSDFTFEFNQWLANTVDTLNETVTTAQDSFNLLNAPSYTAAEIATLQSDGDLNDGVVLYDTTNTVYVGRISGALVKFTTAAYP